MIMRQSYKALLLVVAALLAGAGCERTDPDEKVFSSEFIRFSADVQSTKGFLDQSTITYDNTQFKVYDYLSGYTGSISGHSDGTEFMYFDSDITYDDSREEGKQWVFHDDAAYRWTHTGTHKFFGYLLQDGQDYGHLKTSSFFSTYTPATESTHAITLGKTFTKDSYQYDFLYSDLQAVNTDDGIPATVPLPMNHLFAALGMSVSNFSEAAVEVLSVTLPEFPAKNTVKVDWGDLTGNVAVTSPSGGAYPDPVYDSAAPFMTTGAFPSGGVTLPAKSGNTDEYDVFTGTKISDSNPLTFKMVWPVSISRLRPENPYTGPQTGANVGREYQATDSLICVSYRVNGISSSVRIKFPAEFDDPQHTGMFLRAGTKTHLNLQFLDKQILLK